MSSLILTRSKFLKNDLRYILFAESIDNSITPLGKTRAHGIIEETIAQIAKKGALPTSFIGIAKKAGVPRASVAHYFPTLEDLQIKSFKFIRALYQAYVMECVGDEKNPALIFEKYFFASLQWPGLFSNYAKAWMAFLHLAKSREDFRELNTESVRIGYERLVALVTMGQKAGVFKTADTETATRAVHLILTGLIWSEATETNPHFEQQRQALYNQCVRILNS